MSDQQYRAALEERMGLWISPFGLLNTGASYKAEEEEEVKDKDEEQEKALQ